MTEPRRHALSFDVEEFFHVANLRHAFPKERWDEVPSRLDVGMDALLSLLDKRGARATMFFLGWVAVRRPDLVKRCHDAGHEIASHGWEHEFLWDLEGRMDSASTSPGPKTPSKPPASRARWASAPRRSP